MDEICPLETGVAFGCVLLVLATASTLLYLCKHLLKKKSVTFKSKRARRKERSTCSQPLHNHLTRRSVVVRPTEHDADWENVFRIEKPPVATLSTRIEVERPCHNCKRVSAKKTCQLGLCATCCNSNPESICQAHGTGYRVAAATVDQACQYGFYELDISYSYLRSCPKHVIDVGSQLVSLNLSNNRLSQLPEDIGRLHGLEELFVQYNFLTSLPESVCCLERLAELDAKNNQLSVLPAGIGNLIDLQVLCLTTNTLSSLPSSIGRLTHLEELSLHCNALQELPSEICDLFTLKMLYLGENKIKSLPTSFGQLKKLEELDLSGCKLSALPDSICQCLSLKRLWLSRNRLTSLPVLIGDLQNLQELHLRKNCLKVFPSSIARLPLYTFTAQNNPVIHESMGKKLGRVPLVNFPPLLELAARAVTGHNVPWDSSSVPGNLSTLLSQTVRCSLCNQRVFSYYSCQVVFRTVGVFYRLPLYEHFCSPHIPGLCLHRVENS